MVLTEGVKLESIRTEAAFAEITVFLMYCKFEHKTVCIEDANTFTGEEAEMITQRTVSDVLDSLKIYCMEWAQSFSPFKSIDLGGESKRDSQEQMVGMNIKGESAFD